MGVRSMHSGIPYDNDSVATCLAELPAVAEAPAITVSTEHGDFSGVQATSAQHLVPDLDEVSGAQVQI